MPRSSTATLAKGLESAEAFTAQQPLGRLVEPEEVSALIAWLAGPQSAAATDGIYPLDGGLAL
jgi:NAD(P)-dependent dehydrogenase (short-subunit alcohol dehydrogenase family)